LVEPDPHNLSIGKINFALNQFQGNFLQAGIGQFSKTYQPFPCDDGVVRHLPMEDLLSLFERFCLDYLDILLLDIQGAETDLLKGGEDLFKNRKIRFVMVSTHHHSISRDYLTHQKCLNMLKSWGAHIIAEHTVQESYGGDGLIAVSFSEQDRDLSVKVSHARSKESLFGELEHDLEKVRLERNQERNQERLARDKQKEIESTQEFMLSRLSFYTLFNECLYRILRKFKKLIKLR
jgi:hypothetical protein